MDDLISEFIVETTENLAMLDQELVKLEQDPGNIGILGNIFRIVHTIKGTSGFLGLGRLGALAHASENVLGLIRDGEIAATPAAISLILESLDDIKKLVEHVEKSGAEPEGTDESLIGRLNHFADMRGKTEAPAPAATPPEDLSHFFAGDDELAALAEAEKLKPHTDSSPEAMGLALAEIHPLAPAAATPKMQEQAKEKDTAAASTGANQSIRVNIDVLENLMQMVSELVLSRNQLLQLVRTHPETQQLFQNPVQQISYITSELQEGIMKTRMQPIGNAWSKFPRLIRDLSLELGKKIELHMIGEETELDRQLLEMIKDPLTHMVRNSCDHGLETPADRMASGKTEIGTVTLSAYHEGGHIIIGIEDNGRGLNIERIKKKILENSLATQTELDTLTDQQIMQYIFRAGFSTAEKVTSVSGRGVGMDVVRTNIEKMGGTIELFSELGKGSRFLIKIPLTLAIVSVLIVECSGQRFAIPQINVQELVAVAPDSEYVIESVNGTPVLRLRDKLLSMGSLGQILGLQSAPQNWADTHAHVVVCKIGSNDFGLIVDRVHDTEEIVVKPVAARLKPIEIYSGNTILGDGSVIMILDPNGIAQNIGSAPEAPSSQNAALAEMVETNKISFLLFKSGKGAPKAVPLELISRLEEIDVASVEMAGNTTAVQYRDDLMRLTSLTGELTLPESGLLCVIVFTYDRRNIGLVVDEILDIVETPYHIKLGTNAKSCLGSMVIAEKTTDIVDVAQIVSDLVENAITAQRKARGKHKDTPCNLLLLEDSPFFRNLTEPFLAAAGYQVTCVENGQEGLEILEKMPDHFQVIVTDLEMPVMNGIEFAMACKNNVRICDIPLVAYTAAINEDLMHKTLGAGILQCIPKTDRPGLLQAVADVLLSTSTEIAA